MPIDRVVGTGASSPGPGLQRFTEDLGDVEVLQLLRSRSDRDHRRVGPLSRACHHDDLFASGDQPRVAGHEDDLYAHFQALADRAQDHGHGFGRAGTIEAIGVEEHGAEMHPMPLLLQFGFVMPRAAASSAASRRVSSVFVGPGFSK